jgi:hypothetical protein
VKLNFFYLHCFMLGHCLDRFGSSLATHSALEGVFPKHWQLEQLLSRAIARDNVYVYGDDFDSQVHEELKRQRRCLNRALVDYFKFGNYQGRQLSDIVYFELLNEKEAEAEKVEAVARYIEETMGKLRRSKDNLKVIVNEEEKFSWKTIMEL